MKEKILKTGELTETLNFTKVMRLLKSNVSDIPKEEIEAYENSLSKNNSLFLD